jgi:membrane protease YdiL (CAAX protease family)
VRTLVAWLFAAPDYPPSPADLRTVDVAGLRLPVRATVVIVVTTLAVIFDFSRTFIPDDLIAYDRNPVMQRLQALDRLALFVAVPLLVLVAGLRDDPRRYGLRLGDWRIGAMLALLGCALMTPVVLWFASQPDARAYYAPSAEPLPGLLLTNVLDLASAEFLFRGFLMFTLVRVIGPLGVLVAVLPFVFTHLTKPELELLSTLGGGMLYGWLAWRTGSILWGAFAHVYILTVLIAAAGAAV